MAMTGPDADDAAVEPPDPVDAARSAIPSWVQPLDVDGVRAVGVGVVVWAIALVVLVLFRAQLAAHDASWWIWTAVAGLLGGLVGVWFLVRRRDRGPRG